MNIHKILYLENYRGNYLENYLKNHMNFKNLNIRMYYSTEGTGREGTPTSRYGTGLNKWSRADL